MMAKYALVCFNDGWTVRKTTFFGMFESYVDLTRENEYWMTWQKGRLCFNNCVGTKERAIYVYNLTLSGTESKG